MAYRFRVISDNLVECTDTENGDKVLLTEEEAVLLGFVRFTYRGEPITKAEFAKLIGVTDKYVCNTCSNHNISTGEEVIAFIKSSNEGKISYQNQLMSVKHFSELIGRDDCTVRRMIVKNGYTTGEQVLADFAERDRIRASKAFTYNGKVMSLNEFVRTAHISWKTVLTIIRDTGINNGEEIIEYHKEHCGSKENCGSKEHYWRRRGSHPISYMGKRMSISEFIELSKLAKQPGTVWFLIKQKGFATGEQVIEYYTNKEKKLTFGGKSMQLKTLAEKIGKSRSAITQIMQKYGYSTGEEIIEHYRRKGLL